MAEQRKNLRELNDIERALSSLAPRCGGVNRDQLMYLAGQASVECASQSTVRTPWLWPASTALSTAAALLMGVLLFHGPDHSSSDSIAHEGQSENRTETVDQRLASSQDQPSSLSVPPRSTVAQGDAATDAVDAVAPRGWVRFVRTRQTALTRGIDAIPELEVRTPQEAVVASTYWDESKRLLPRQSTRGMEDAERGRFPIWRDMFMTGEHL